MLKHCKKELGEPNGWDRVLEKIEKEIAKANKVSSIPEIYRNARTKALVRALYSSDKQSYDGRLAELELTRRIKEAKPTTVNGPATLIQLNNGNLEFYNLSPAESKTGQLIAYDIGIYD